MQRNITKQLLRILLLSTVVAIVQSSAPVRAQSAFGNGNPNVYLDCFFCFESYIRTNVDFINYVRDQEDADIYLRITSASTGSGREYTLDFRGIEPFSSLRIPMTYNSHNTDSSDERRVGLVNHIKVGLVPFLTDSELTPNLRVSYEPPQSAGPSATVASDPWNSWVFDTNLGFSMNAEETSSNLGLNSNFSAERITHLWKIETRVGGSLNRRTIELSDRTRHINRDRADYWGNITYSIGDHLAVGVFSNMNYSRLGNTLLNVRVAPAIEYSVFPYSEFQERRIFIQYSAAPSYRNYAERTIYLKDSETIMQQELSMQIRYDQPWGRIDVRISGSNYFHDFSFNRMTFNPSFDIRLTRSLSFNVSGQYRSINDQLSLPGGNIDDEDLLLGLQSQATSYDYRISFGISYTFGSVFSGVVNPRL